MTKQIQEGQMTLRQCMQPALFSRGFEDAWQGLPPRYDIDPPPAGRANVINRLWAYERGRAFATWAKAQGMDPRPLKQGNRVRYGALQALQAAVNHRAVI